MSRLFCPCLCLHCHCSLPVPLSPCAAELKARRSSSSCGPQTPALESRRPKQLLNIVYVILCFVARIKFLLHPHSASESFSTHTLTDGWTDGQTDRQTDNALRYFRYSIKKLLIVLLFMESNALCYFAYIFVTWAGLPYLFLITENPKVTFLSTVKALSQKE